MEADTNNPIQGVGGSPQYIQVLKQARRLAGVPRPILIRGERGTGKELMASIYPFA